MPEPASAPAEGLQVLPVRGLPEVTEGADLAALIAAAAALEDGDVVVVSSKVVSKALGLWAPPGDLGARDAVVASQTVRVVAERRSGGRLTRIVVAAAGPVMAAAGVDASNTGGRDALLLLPADPDAEAERLRTALLAATGLRRLGVLLSDTAGRPWRFGQTDFALGAAGVAVVDDLRGGVDADGRPLGVTARAVGDELAAAADLVKGKVDAVPAAVVRGTGWALAGPGPGTGPLVRAAADDWFDYGRAEAVRAALGVEPGSEAALAAGVADVGPEPPAARAARAAAVAGHGLPGATLSVDGDLVRVRAADRYVLGQAVARLQAALWAERLAAQEPVDAGEGTVEVVVRPR